MFENLKDVLSHFMDTETSTKKNSKKTDGKAITVNKEDADWQIFQKRNGDVDKFFKENFLINREDYKYYGHLGENNRPFVKVYYMALVNEKPYIKNGIKSNNKIKSGRYVVYLLSEDHSKLFLCFAIGVSETTEIEKTAQDIRHCINDSIKEYGFSELLDYKKLGDSELSKKYAKGTICYKEYEKDHLPENNILANDLQDILALYDDFESQYVGIDGEVSITKKK